MSLKTVESNLLLKAGPARIDCPGSAQLGFEYLWGQCLHICGPPVQSHHYRMLLGEAEIPVFLFSPLPLVLSGTSSGHHWKRTASFLPQEVFIPMGEMLWVFSSQGWTVPASLGRYMRSSSPSLTFWALCLTHSSFCLVLFRYKTAHVFCAYSYSSILLNAFKLYLKAVGVIFFFVHQPPKILSIFDLILTCS